MRKTLAGLSAGGMVVSLYAYDKSLSGTTIDDMFSLLILLTVGAVAIHIPIFISERSSVRERKFFWRDFSRGMPTWVVPFIKLVWLIGLAHFVWLIVTSHRGVAGIQDDQWVLSSRGRIIKVLTEPEYLRMKAGYLRAYAIYLVGMYVQPMMYWWFPRNQHRSLAAG